MSLSPGARLGPYEILSPLGAGGMGEVWKARDPRLGREVAIKVLPASFSRDTERLKRFEQEARAAGVLNHPNITAVYDVGTHEGGPYVVSELLEGETLGMALAAGHLSPRQALDYGIQIAHGLAAAHEKRIVHRDLKPENLFVTRDGRVKILDFGLAKLVQPAVEESRASRGPTLTPGTEPGVVLGTVGYMSPEQVRGHAADTRSDIFSLGVVLYEMLSGRRAFARETGVQTMNAILTEDPPEISTPDRPVAPSVERIVRRCLEKRPEQRFRSAGDLAFALEAVSGVSVTASEVPGAPARKRSRPLAALALLAVVAAAAAGGFFWGREKGSEAAKPAAFHPLTFRRGDVPVARFSPDGRTVFYHAAWEGAPFEIFSTATNRPGMRSLGLPPPARLAAVSSTGELAVRLGARAGTSGTLARLSPEGGAPREVLEDAFEADWAPDGGSLAVVRGKRGAFRIEYPIGTRLFESQTSLTYVRVSPRGDRVAFIHRLRGDSVGSSVRVVDRNGRVTTLSKEWPALYSLAWSPDGEEVWFSGGGAAELPALRAVSLNGRERLVARAPGALYLHDIYRDGRVLVNMGSFRRAIAGLAPGETRERDLSWFDASRLADLSFDGRTVLFEENGMFTGSSVYLRRTDGAPAVRLADGRALALSRDGLRALSAAGSRLILLPTGAGEARPLDLRPLSGFDAARWFPDGKKFLAEGSEPAHPIRLYLCDAAGGKPVELGPALEGVAAISPDGTSFVFRNAGEGALLRRGLDGSPARPVPGAGPRDVVAGWSADGKSLFVYSYGAIPIEVARLDLESGKRTPWKSIAPADPAGINTIFPLFMAADGQSYAYGYIRVLADLYVVEGWR